MDTLLLTAMLVAAASSGPPVLPPVPGEQPPPDEDVPLDPAQRPTPAPRPPQRPTPAPPPKSAPDKPTPRPAQPPPATSDAPDPPPDPPPQGDAWSIPQADAPPQPEVGGPPPEDAPTEAPAERKEPEAPLDPPELPGDEVEDRRPRIPPPERPPYRGTGFFIGAGVTFGIALAEQIVGHILVKRQCIDPIGRGEFEDTEDVGDIFAGCAPGVLPALALRLHSDLGLLATIGLVAGGAILRGQQDAWDDVFATPKPRKLKGLRVGGISLIGAGIVTWFVTGATAWGVLGKCTTARCANAARAMAFTTRDVSAIMVASGAGMLGYAEAVRRHTSRFVRDKALSAGPVLTPTFVGFSLRSRF